MQRVNLTPGELETCGKSVASLCLLFFAVASVPGSVWAGPPLKTDDPETPGRGGWEVNISHNIERTKHGFLMESPLVDINYGLLENDQWKIEFPVLFVDPDDERDHWGVGDLQLGWKYRFLDEEEHGWMASIYPQPLVPTGNHGVGLSDGRFEMLLPIQVGKHFYDDKLLVYGEVGYNVVFGDSEANEVIYGLAAEWEASEGLELLFEVGGVAFPEDDEPDDTFFNVGVKCDLTDNVTILSSAGRSFHDRDRGTLDLLAFFGFQFTWGGNDYSEE